MGEFLDLAAGRVEHGISAMRLVLFGLGAVWLLAVKRQPLFAFAPKELFIASCLVLGTGLSVIALTRKRHAGQVLYISVFCDALLAFLVLLPGTLQPSGYRYAGLLRNFTPALFLITTTAAGLRLSRAVAAFGIVCNAAAFFALLMIDKVRWSAVIEYDAPALAIASILFVGAAALGLFIARRTRWLVYQGAKSLLLAERARQRLGVYVSTDVADAALAAPMLSPGGKRYQVAVLFSDLRGFAHWAETLTPERLIAELNAYLEAMVESIREEGGVVDKFIGDAIMVVFGAPTAREDAALRAIRTASGMQRALERHNAERRGRGLEPLAHGIGVHYGTVVAGHVGTSQRLQFTVLGDVVNVASRLQSATKDEEMAVLISEETVDAARKHGVELPFLHPHRSLRLRGRDGEMPTYTLACPK